MDASSEHVSLDAVKHALGIVGIKPASEPQISVSLEMRAGYVIDLSERDERPEPGKLRLVEEKSDEA